MKAMAITASNNGGTTYEPVSEGAFIAICYSIVDLGDQYSEKFGNTSRKVLLTWELPDETIEIEGEIKPRAISKEYTLSLNEKANLKKDLEAWRGKKFTEEELKGFDLENVLGKACQLQIVHSTKENKTYANIAAIMGLPKGVKPGAPKNQTVYFDIEADNALSNVNLLPTWVQDKIKKSEQYKAMVNGGMSDDSGFYAITDDDLPF
jgi:hypothetical protein